MLNEDQKSALLCAARRVMDKAYAPYSGFRVGAAILGASGAIHVGCNVENSSYPVGTCAERNAIGAATAAGETSILAVVIVASHPTPVPPCGMCRQALNELGPDVIVISIGNLGDERTWTVRELLPDAFDSGMLDGRSR